MIACTQKELDETPSFAGGGLRYDYFKYTTVANGLKESYLGTQTKNQVNDIWGTGPLYGTSNDLVSIFVTGGITVPSSGDYTFCTCSDDGASMAIGQTQLFSYVQDNQTPRWWGATVTLEAGTTYPFSLAYRDNNNEAMLQMYWIQGGGQCFEEGNAATYGCEPGVDTLPSNVAIVPPSVFSPPSSDYQDFLASCFDSHDFVGDTAAPDPTQANTKRALALIRRLAGVNVDLHDSRVAEIKAILDDGGGAPSNARARLAATTVINRFHEFYDVTALRWAARRTTKELTPDAPLDDMSATIVGIIRDGIDWRYALFGNFVYRMNRTYQMNNAMAALSSRDNLLQTNNHYDAISQAVRNEGLSLRCMLSPLSQAEAINPPSYMVQTVPVPEPDTPDDEDKSRTKALPVGTAAGVLTSRAWAAAHMIAGTNRRAVEYTLKVFLGLDMTDIKDTELPDDYIARDVERSDAFKYMTDCKGCHASLDGFKPAFASFNFSNGIMKYGPFFMADPLIPGDQDHEASLQQANNENIDNFKFAPNPVGFDPALLNLNNYTARSGGRVHYKLAHNVVDKTIGYDTPDDSYVNMLPYNSTFQSMIGFTNVYMSGNGPAQFGANIANSRLFALHTARTIYEEVCNADWSTVAPSEKAWVEQLGDELAGQQYRLKDIFAAAAVACMEAP